MKHLTFPISHLTPQTIFLTALLLSASLGFAQIPAPGNMWYKAGDKVIHPVAKAGEWFIGFKSEVDLGQGIALLNGSGAFEKVQPSEIHRPFHAVKVSLKKGKILSDAQKSLLLHRWVSKPEVSFVREALLLDGEAVLVGNIVMAAPASVLSSGSARSFLERQGYKYEVYPFGSLEMYKIKLEQGKEIFQEVHALEASRLFEFVEPDVIASGKSDVIPNDPYFGNQWFLNQSSDADIDAPEAWDITIGLSSVRVAVIDGNGYDLGHTELSGRFYAPYDAVNNNTSPYPENANANHGTPCAGLIAGRTNNATGVASVGHNILFVPVSMGYNATNDGGFTTSSSIMTAACSHVTGVTGVAAVSNSYSLGSWATSNTAVRNAFANMRTQSRSGFGAVILASSGNNSNSAVNSAPAGYPLVIAVGSSDQYDVRASYSNYGDSLDLVAPGVNTYTVDRTGTNGYETGSYTYFNGTSAACPVAAGVVGLMASANTSLMGGQLATYLQKSCEKVGGYSYLSTSGRPHGTWNNKMGYGRINARAAVCMAAGPSACGTPPPTGLCSSPLNASCGSTYYGNNGIGANNYNTYSKNGTTIFTEMYGPEVFYVVTLNQASSLSISLSGLSADLDLILLSSCSSNSILAYSGNGNTSSEAINTNILPAGTYRIVVDGWNYAISNYLLTVNCGTTPPCSTPLAGQLFASNVTTVSARLNTHYQNATSHDWRYRITGSSTWIDLNSTTSKYVDISNLTPYTTYEFQCSAYCGGTWTAWSPSQYFGTGFPINNEPCGAVELLAGNTCYQIWGTNSAGSATWNPSMPGTCNTANMRDVWYKVLVPSNGKVKISTFAITMNDAVVAFYTGSCGNLSPVNPYCIDDTNGDYMPDVSVTSLAAGTWLYIRIWGYDGAMGAFTICAETLSNLKGDDGSENAEARTEINNKETAASPLVQLFPVPAQQELTLSTTLAQESNVFMRITSLAGQLIKEETLTQAPAGAFSHTMDLSGIPAGAYLLRFNSSGAESVHKFMKF